jgi:hypothetical protein
MFKLRSKIINNIYEEKSLLNRLLFLVYALLVLLPFGSYFYWLVLKKSAANSMSGLPWSDATGWHACILALSKFGTLPAGGVDDFCLRRPVYPFLLSLMRSLTNNSEIVNFSLVLMFSIAGFVLLFNLYKLNKPYLGISIYLLAFWKWIDYGQGQYLTESLGIILAILAATYVVRFAKSFSLYDFFGLVFYLVLIDLVRPSDALIKFIVFLLFLIITKSWKEKLKGFLGGLYLVLLLPQSIKTMLQFAGFDNLIIKSNSWAVVYGLVHGNQPYTYADSIRSQYPGITEAEFWNILKEDSLNKIFREPTSLISPIIDNFAPFVKSLNSVLFTNYFSQITREFNGIFTLLFILSIFAIITSIFTSLAVNNSEKARSYEFAKQQILALLFVLSTILGYLVTYLNDAHRTNSPAAIYGFGALFLGISNLRVNKVSKKNNTVSATGRTKSSTLYAIVIQNLILIIAITAVGINKSIPNYINIECENKTDIYLLPETVAFKRISSIEPNTNFYWSRSLTNLPEGILIQGLYINNSELLSANIFIRQTEVNLQEVCFREVNSDFSRELIDLGYVEKRAVKF